MNRFLYTNILFIVFSILILGCTPQVEPKPNKESKMSYKYTIEKSYFKVDFGSSDSVVYDISNLDKNNIYLIKGNPSVTNTAFASVTGSAKSVNSEKVFSRSQSTVEYPIRRENERALYFRTQDHSSFVLPTKRAGEPVVKYGKTGKSLGEKKSFWVEYKNGNYESQEASLYGIGNYCYFWVIDKYFTDNSSDASKVTQQDIDGLINKFDGDNGIYSLVTNVFGNEPGGGINGDGGRDSDQHISFLIYDIDEDYEENQSSGVLGFFNQKDYYTQDYLNSNGYSDKTNNMEILYLDSYFINSEYELMISTLAHELQHLIHFNEKQLIRKKTSSTWFNEMMSLVCEDMVSSSLMINSDSSSLRWIPYFNADYAKAGVNTWSNVNYRSSYATSFMYGAFLARNYGGVELLSLMSKSDSVDYGSILDGLQVYNTNHHEAFDVSHINNQRLFEEYIKALIIDNPNGNEPSFSKEKTMSFVGNEYTFMPFNIWDYSQAGSSSSGPSLFGVGEQVKINTQGITIHSSPAWFDVSGTISITFEKPADSSIIYYMSIR